MQKGDCTDCPRCDDKELDLGETRTVKGTSLIVKGGYFGNYVDDAANPGKGMGKYYPTDCSGSIKGTKCEMCPQFGGDGIVIDKSTGENRWKLDYGSVPKPFVACQANTDKCDPDTRQLVKLKQFPYHTWVEVREVIPDTPGDIGCMERSCRLRVTYCTNENIIDPTNTESAEKQCERSAANIVIQATQVARNAYYECPDSNINNQSDCEMYAGGHISVADIFRSPQ